VVAVGANAGPDERRSALDHEAVGQLPHPRAEGGEALGQGRDAVALLHPELGGAGHGKRPLGEGGRHRAGRHLVDERGDEGGVDRCPAEPGRRGHDRPHRLRPGGLEAGLDAPARRLQHLDERGSGGGEEDTVEADLGVRQDEGGHDEEGGTRGVAGDRDLGPL
jgi:hypothetical protein